MKLVIAEYWLSAAKSIFATRRQTNANIGKSLPPRPYIIQIPRNPMEAAKVQACRKCGKYWLIGGSSTNSPKGEIRNRTRIHQCITCGAVSVLRPAELAQVTLGAFFPQPTSGDGSVAPFLSDKLILARARGIF
ncbi:MAG: hypothetical protein V1820_05005 [archaeon]